MDDALIKHIAEKWSCTPERYPEMSHLNSDEQFRFVLRHAALHFAKTAGKIAATSEDADHGNILNVADLKTNVAKSLINTLHLAAQLHMTTHELEAAARKIIDAN